MPCNPVIFWFCIEVARWLARCWATCGLRARRYWGGASGAVVDGAVRDLDGLALAELPALALGVAPMAAYAMLIPFPCDQPTRFAGVTVMPDDWVSADCDGVLFVLLEWLQLVLDAQVAVQAGATARDTFSREFLPIGCELPVVFPVPQDFVGLLDAFRRGVTSASADPVCEALTESELQ